MPRVNIISILGFSTKDRAIIARGSNRASNRTADEDNKYDDTVNATTRAEVKREKYFHPWELRSKSEVRGRVVKMKSRFETQQRIATLPKTVVKSTTGGWIKQIRFLCSSAWSATVRVLRKLQGVEVPALTTAPMDAAWPNPSLKRSANGRPPAPGRWYAVHFHRPGAGVLPLSPA